MPTEDATCTEHQQVAQVVWKTKAVASALARWVAEVQERHRLAILATESHSMFNVGRVARRTKMGGGQPGRWEQRAAAKALGTWKWVYKSAKQEAAKRAHHCAINEDSKEAAVVAQ